MEEFALRVVVKLSQALDSLERGKDGLEGPADSSGWSYVFGQVVRATTAVDEAQEAFRNLLEAIRKQVKGFHPPV